MLILAKYAHHRHHLPQGRNRQDHHRLRPRGRRTIQRPCRRNPGHGPAGLRYGLVARPRGATSFRRANAPECPTRPLGGCQGGRRPGRVHRHRAARRGHSKRRRRRSGSRQRARVPYAATWRLPRRPASRSCSSTPRRTSRAQQAPPPPQRISYSFLAGQGCWIWRPFPGPWLSPRSTTLRLLFCSMPRLSEARSLARLRRP